MLKNQEFLPISYKPQEGMRCEGGTVIEESHYQSTKKSDEGMQNYKAKCNHKMTENTRLRYSIRTITLIERSRKTL